MDNQFEMFPEFKFWQTLVRVVKVEDNVVTFVIPAWMSEDENEDNKVQMSLKDFPEEIQKIIKPKIRFFADVNLGATKLSQLIVKDFKFRGL
jgi:hypothetical protein